MYISMQFAMYNNSCKSNNKETTVKNWTNKPASLLKLCICWLIEIVEYSIFCCKSKDFFWLLLVSETPFLSSSIFFRQIIINSTNYWPWISYDTTENLEFNESSWCLIFSLISLICMSDNVLKLVEVIFSGSKLFVTSESERVNENFGVQEKSIWSLEKSWKIVSEEGYRPCVSLLHCF